MFRNQLNNLAQSADRASDIAYGRGKWALGKGKDVYGQGRLFLNSAGSRARDIAKEVRKNAATDHIVSGLSSLQSQLGAFKTSTRESLGRTYAGIGAALWSTEHALLKGTLGYLAIKWFQNRDKDLKTMASDVRTHVVEKPIASMALVLAVGYIFGRLRK